MVNPEICLPHTYSFFPSLVPISHADSPNSHPFPMFLPGHPPSIKPGVIKSPHSSPPRLQVSCSLCGWPSAQPSSPAWPPSVSMSWLTLSLCSCLFNHLSQWAFFRVRCQCHPLHSLNTHTSSTCYQAGPSLDMETWGKPWPLPSMTPHSLWGAGV